MPWFGVNCRFQRTLDGESFGRNPIILVDAIGEGDAKQLAEQFALADESCYLNMFGEVVTWKLVGIDELYEILDESPKSGSTVFSRHLKSTRGSL